MTDKVNKKKICCICGLGIKSDEKMITFGVNPEAPVYFCHKWCLKIIKITVY